MYKVLIVDDSDVARQLLMSIFALSDDFLVVGVAENGQQGFEKACSLRPDLITMDLHMPVMNGYKAVEIIMSEQPAPIMVITSYKESETAFRCIALGALDVLDKPGLYDLEDTFFIDEFLDRARLLATTRVIRRISSGLKKDSTPSGCNRDNVSPDCSRESGESPAKSKQISAEMSREAQNIDAVEFSATTNGFSISVDSDRAFDSGISFDSAGITNLASEHLVAIASSTGGPQALCEFLKDIPADFPAAILIVQHLSAGFEEGFALWLSGHTPLNVKIAEDGELLSSGSVLIAPPGKHVIVTQGRLVKFHEALPVASHKPSAKFLFESAALVYGAQATGVILTGMGSDGSVEIGEIKKAGGLTIGQDEETSIIYGMPGVAAKLGTVTEILPVEKIAPRVVSWVTG